MSLTAVVLFSPRRSPPVGYYAAIVSPAYRRDGYHIQSHGTYAVIAQVFLA
jgi:hypothetical protein